MRKEREKSQTNGHTVVNLRQYYENIEHAAKANCFLVNLVRTENSTDEPLCTPKRGHGPEASVKPTLP